MEFDQESQKPVSPKELSRNGLTRMSYEMSKHCLRQVVLSLCLVAGGIVIQRYLIHESVPVGAI
ncbi:hypothetical protein LQ764DRAFT_234330, partial [Zygosaccharomyces rouxii]